MSYMSYKTFEQWYALLGFLAIVFVGLIYPVLTLRSEGISGRKRIGQLVLGLIVVLSLIAPYLAVVEEGEQAKLIDQSGLLTSFYTFVLFYLAQQQRTYLLAATPYFFWFVYASAVFVAIELLARFILLSGQYQFVKVIFPYLSRIGIQDFNFLSPIDYVLKFAVLSLFFRDVLKPESLKKTYQFLAYGLVLFELIQVFVFKSYQGYDSLSSTVKNSFLVASTTLFLYRFYQTTSVTISLQRNSYFWIGMGLLMPALAEFFLEFIFEKLYRTDTTEFYRLYLLRNTSQLGGIVLLLLATTRASLLRFLPNDY